MSKPYNNVVTQSIQYGLGEDASCTEKTSGRGGPRNYLSIRCILGDMRLWVGDPSTSSCLVSLSLSPGIARNWGLIPGAVDLEDRYGVFFFFITPQPRVE